MSKSVKFWDRMANRANRQDASVGGSEIKTVEITKKYLKSSDSVLDYACGTGSMTIDIARHVETMDAMDISPRMLEVVKERAQHNNIENIQFTQGTLSDAPYDDESFDAVLAFNILHLLEDPQLAVHKVNRLLKPGGFFISATACLGESRLMGVFLSLMSKTGLVPYVKRVNQTTLEVIMTDGGFQIIEMERPEPMNTLIVARKN
jgi:ubiquinone/menaquinone biosynthesis C-methylase UbiE